MNDKIWRILINLIISLIIGTTAFILCLIWFNWKLFLIIFLCQFADNVSKKCKVK